MFFHVYGDEEFQLFNQYVFIVIGQSAYAFNDKVLMRTLYNVKWFWVHSFGSKLLQWIIFFLLLTLNFCFPSSHLAATYV